MLDFLYLLFQVWSPEIEVSEISLGLKWGGPLLGFIALAMTPIPFIFYKFGSKLRQMSKMAPTEEEPYKLEQVSQMDECRENFGVHLQHCLKLKYKFWL